MPDESGKKRRIAVVGAGPAGLVAALAARRLGFDVRVFEQAQNFSLVGGGVLIHSNGQRVLEALGLLESFKPQMVSVEKGVIQGERERILTEIDFSELDVPHSRVAVVWRYQLQEHLLKAALEAGIDVNFNHRLTGLELHENQSVLNFENDSVESADVIIGADGVNSRTRAASGMRFEKIAVGESWIRGASDVFLSNTAFREIWGNDGRRFGIAPLTDNKTYFYARVSPNEWEDVRENRLPEWIESWREFGADVTKILLNVRDWRKINYSELYEIHAPAWAKPPVFLVGDAAHAMTPNVGQGANSAMVDSLVLLVMLKEAGETGKTLTEVGSDYTNLRRPFVTKIQNTARQSGALAAKTSMLAHIARDVLFAASSRLSFLRRQSLLLSAGYNPPENKYFDALRKAGSSSR
jgi:2-polyprenyl-6-methoxyphenol hydroxylase-like FAD-dependent oxidoreductase